MSAPDQREESTRLATKPSSCKWSNTSPDAVSAASRQRVSQACDKCRNRKEKCDGRKPKCSACVKRKQPCSYDPSVKKRGLREGYVRHLEGYTQTLEGYVGDLEITCSLLMQREQRFRPSIPEEEHSCKDELLNAWVDQRISGRLRNMWRQSELFQELKKRNSIVDSLDEKLFRRDHTDKDNSLALYPENATLDVDSGSESVILVDDFAAATEKSTQGSRRVDHPPSEKLCTNQVLNLDFPSNTNVIPKLPSRAWRLLDIYFTHTHSWLPVVEKHDVLRTYHEFSIKGQDRPPNPQRSGSQAVLWSILAFTDIQYAKIRAPNVREPERGSLSTTDLYLHARSLLPGEDEIFDIRHIQSLLILALLNLGINKPQAAWLLSGQAVRLALQLGLNQQGTITSETSSSSVRMRGKHVFLGCFTVDTLISSRLKMPPHLMAEDIDGIGGKIEEIGLEEWDAWSDTLGLKSQEMSSPLPPRICSTFNKLVVTIRSLNKMARSVSYSTVNVCSSGPSTGGLHATENNGQTHEHISLAWAQEINCLPHHFNLYLARISVMMNDRIRRHKLPNLGDVAETVLIELSQFAIEMSRILSKFENTFGLAIAPPITECFVSVLLDGYQILKESHSIFPSALNEDWKLSMHAYISRMHGVWPVFGPLEEALQMDLVTKQRFDMIQPHINLGITPDLDPGSCCLASPVNITTREIGCDTNQTKDTNNMPNRISDQMLGGDISGLNKAPTSITKGSHEVVAQRPITERSPIQRDSINLFEPHGDKFRPSSCSNINGKPQ